MSAPVVVAGAGIAGCALALGLDRAGIDVVVCEEHPDGGADAGAFLTLAANGVRALRAIDAADAVAAVSEPMDSMRILDAAGAELTRRRLGGPDEDVAFRCLARAELAGTLRELTVRRGVVIRHGARVVGATPGPGAVRVHLGDGTELAASLLVGADGLHSAVRTLVDPSASAPRPVGQRIHYGSAPVAFTAHTGDFHVLRADAAAFGAVPVAGGSTWWFARVDTAVPYPQPDPDPRAALLAVLGEGPAAALVAASDRLFVTDAHDLPFVGPWSGQRMLIIGDAAHAASPATGQGASMALEDAVVLAKALREHAMTGPAPGGTASGGTGKERAAVGDPATALAVYERARRGRTQANVLASAAMSGHPVPGAEEGEQVPDAVLHEQLDWARPLG